VRKLKWSALLVALVIFVAGFAVYLKLIAQRADIASRGPLTISELERLAAKWREASQDDSATSSSASSLVVGVEQGTVERADRSGIGDPRAAERDAPSRSASLQEAGHATLKRCLTQAEKDAAADDFRRSNREPLGVLMISGLEFATTALLSAGADPGPGGMHYCEAAQVAFMSTADWATAKRLYRQALDYPVTKQVREHCCLRLAWMEDDPVVASRLLELACPANEETSYYLEEAIRLAHKTGSRDLFDQYVGRLQRLNPERAQQFRSLDWAE